LRLIVRVLLNINQSFGDVITEKSEGLEYEKQQ